MVCGLWADYLFEKGNYDTEGIAAIAAALRVTSSLELLNIRFNLLVEKEAQTLRASAQGRAGFDLKV